ncbi:MAG: Flp family type IVb pilin [Hellea sp.]
MLKNFLSDDSGATAIEYGLIAALISVSLLAGYKAIGDNLTTHWNDVATAVETAGDDFLP